MKTTAPEAALAARILEGLPSATLLVDPTYRVRHANRAARALGSEPGAPLGRALGCADPADGECGAGGRCAGCGFRDVVRQALAGGPARSRGFLMRAGRGGAPADLHLLAVGSPLELGGVTHAVLVLQDLDPILADPGVVRVCPGCGGVEDEEGEWLPLHRYLEDRLGLEAGEALCGGCRRRAEPVGSR